MRQGRLLENKWYLYLTEFFSGMAVMAVELGASKLLAPYFSSSQIVWTIIIGTIMIAMALGNVWGGKNADKHPNPDKLYQRIIVAAIWIAAIPVVGKYIIIGVSGLLVITISNQFLAIAAFVSCMVIFVFPLFLLGTVTPSLAKYTVGSLDDSGKTVGTLGAFNTIGSIIGTFVPTFVTIPAVGTSITFLIFAGILLALALIYFISKRSNGVRCTMAVIILIVCCIFGSSSNFAFWEHDLAYEGESVYNYLQVKEDEEDVILSTNVLFGVQSILKKKEALTGMYYDYAMAAPFLAAGYDHRDQEKMQMLILGMGTGTYATQCMRYIDQVQLEGVEIDDRITDLAHEYFKLPKDMKVTTYDGRAYLQAMDQKYDVIMVDAYQDITIPFQMSSKEFFTLVKDHLKENGVMVVNMNMHSEKKGNINEYLSDTIASVFDTVYTVDVKHSTNRELFASNNPSMKEEMELRIPSIEQEQLRELIGQVNGTMIPYEKGNYLLTDDKAPVEVLGMQVIDELIQDELGYYKDIFRKEGIQGVLKQM